MLCTLYTPLTKHIIIEFCDCFYNSVVLEKTFDILYVFDHYTLVILHCVYNFHNTFDNLCGQRVRFFATVHLSEKVFLWVDKSFHI